MDMRKFTQKSAESLMNAQAIAEEYGNQEIKQTHLLYGLLKHDDGRFTKVATVVGIKFASIDIMDRNGELVVLEVNSGVTLEKFARTSEDNYKKVEELYRKIVFEVLE